LGIYQSLKKTEKNEMTTAANSNSYLLQLVSGLVIVLLSIVVLGWLAKRFNRMQSPGGGNLRIVEGISMGARERVVVVEVDGERLLLGVSPGRINKLHSLGNVKQGNSVQQESIDAGESNQKKNEVTFSQRIAAAMMKERS
jgi:flagellar protein FliO/FliZ